MNIGGVIYKKDFISGKLSADWYLETNNKLIGGTGKAIGDPGNRYEGKYIIYYYDFKGKQSNPYELFIKRKEKTYILEWYQEDRLKCSGIGMLHDNNSLIAGWKNVIE